jgi:hypothetical protein
MNECDRPTAVACSITAVINAVGTGEGADAVDVTTSQEFAVWDSALNKFNVINSEAYFLDGIQEAHHVRLKPAGHGPMSPQGMGTATCFVELLHNGKGHGKLRKDIKGSLSEQMRARTSMALNRDQDPDARQDIDPSITVDVNVDYLVTDDDKSFVSRASDYFCCQRGIKKIVSPPYLHQLNGIAEGAARTLKQ